MPSIRTRIEQAETRAKPEKIACFSVINDVASGGAWWRDDLTWQNLTRREYEHLISELKAEGVKIIELFDIDEKGRQK